MNHKGFTLVELMVSALIAGIFLAMLFPMIHGWFYLWEQEKLENRALKTCDQIYGLLEKRLKVAEHGEIEEFLDGTDYEEKFHDLDFKIEVQIDEAGDEFLFVTVRAKFPDHTVVYEKKGTVITLNRRLGENEDE